MTARLKRPPSQRPIDKGTLCVWLVALALCLSTWVAVIAITFRSI